MHTGEKPFLCTEPGCEMRFTHANRHCPDHPYATLTRSDDFVLKPVSENTELPHDVTRWLERYKMSREREDRTPTGKNERKKKTWKSSSENHKRVKSRKGLMMDATGEQENLDCKQPNQRLYCGESQDSQEESQDEEPAVLQTSEDEEISAKLAITPLRRPLDRLQPKKRWLREACLEQQLAKPLNWDVKPVNVSTGTSSKINGNQMQWSSPVENSSALLDNSCLNACKEIELTKSKADLPYASAQISWDAENESLEQSAKKESKYMFKTSNTLSQNIWNSSQHHMNDFVKNTSQIKTDVNQSTSKSSKSPNHTYWDNNLTNELPISPLNQSKSVLSKIQDFTQKDISKQNTVMNSHISENVTRPTVLMLAGSFNNNNNNNKDTISEVSPMESETGLKVVVVKQEDNLIKLPIPEDSQKWLGALALMELAKNQEDTERGMSFKQNKDEFFVNTELNYTHL